MAVVGGSEAEPVVWCGPPKSQTLQRSAMFLYNGRKKPLVSWTFLQWLQSWSRCQPVQPTQEWVGDPDHGPPPQAFPSPPGLEPPPAAVTHRHLVPPQDSRHPSPGLKWQQKNRSLLRRTWQSTLSSREASTWLSSARRGIAAAFEGLSSRVMGTGDRWEGGGAVFLGQLTWWPTHNWSQTQVRLLCTCNQGWRHFCNTIIWNGFPDAFYFPPRCGTNSPIANTGLRRGKKSWWNSTFKLICCF